MSSKFQIPGLEYTSCNKRNIIQTMVWIIYHRSDNGAGHTGEHRDIRLVADVLKVLSEYIVHSILNREITWRGNTNTGTTALSSSRRRRAFATGTICTGTHWEARSWRIRRPFLIQIAFRAAIRARSWSIRTNRLRCVSLIKEIP